MEATGKGKMFERGRHEYTFLLLLKEINPKFFEFKILNKCGLVIKWISLQLGFNIICNYSKVNKPNMSTLFLSNYSPNYN